MPTSTGGEDALPNPKDSLPASEEALLELLVGTDGVALAGRSGRWRELGSEVGFEPGSEVGSESGLKVGFKSGSLGILIGSRS